MTVEVLSGATQLHVTLSALGVKASRQVIRPALSAGLTIIVRSVRKLTTSVKHRKPRKSIRRGDFKVVKVGQGRGRRRKNIPKAIGQRVGKDRDGVVVAKAGVGVGRGRTNESNWFARVLAIGSTDRFRRRMTINRYRTITGKFPSGRITAEHFVERGYVLSAFAARAKVRSKINEKLWALTRHA